MIMRALRDSGVLASVRTASGNLRPQILEKSLSAAEHKALHALWNVFVESKELSVLKTIPGNGAKLMAELQRPNGLTAQTIFGLLKEFYLRPDVVEQFGTYSYWSVIDLAKRLRI
jgi:hypothetical protein